MVNKTESLAARIAIGDENVQDAEVVEVVESPQGNIIKNDKLVKIFLKIRDARKALSAKFDAEDGALKAQLDTISVELKRRCLNAGDTGFKTEFGTVFITETLKVSCGDWAMFGEWLKTQDPLVYMESRVKSTAIKEYMDAHNGELPPGISIFKESEARVRTPAKKPGKAKADEEE